ncbi:hypothetical protein ASF92_05720 [Pedobacter sp. Leaf176]|nr:hypothetical protein ASF92_05720 [Pedobacter sp. Leaf176]
MLLGYAASAQNTFPATGNVGIGTTGPNSLLQINVAEDSKPGNVVSPSQSVFRMSRSGTANYSYPEAAEFRIGHGGPSVWGSKLELYVNGASNQTNIPDRHAMTWLYNGNVGVGTVSPLNGLHIFSLNNPAGGSLRLGHSGAEAAVLSFGWNGVNEDAFKITKYPYNSDANPTDLFVINSSNGNVGVGTNIPTEKLSVNGKIRAHEIKVEMANWPDYVFDQDYKILGLDELDAYIKANKHLPEMPSAKETESNGIALGEMIKLQQKKLEELTLYIIEQHKLLAESQAALKRQQLEINGLKRRIQ